MELRALLHDAQWYALVAIEKRRPGGDVMAGNWSCIIARRAAYKHNKDLDV